MNILMTLANPFTTDARVFYEAKSLIKAGHKVTILAWGKKKIHPAKEKKEGIQVIRSHNRKLAEILPYDIFKLHFWWISGYKDAKELFEKNHFDVVHSHDLSSLPIGMKLKKKFNLPLIYDAHEIWGYMVHKDFPKVWADYYLWKEKKLLKHVDHIITVNNPLKDYFEKITDKPISIIMNAKPLQKKIYSPPDNKIFTIIYIGGIRKPRFILEIVEAVKDLEDVYCIIGGYKGRKHYIDKLKEKISKIKNTDFIGKVPMKDVLPLTKKADCVVCMTNPNDRNNSIATANKQFEAMVSGRPIICTKGTYPGAFTEKYDVGLTAEFNKESLKKAIVKLRDNPDLCEKLGKNALKNAVEEFNWERQEEKLVKLYENLC